MTDHDRARRLHEVGVFEGAAGDRRRAEQLEEPGPDESDVQALGARLNRERAARELRPHVGGHLLEGLAARLPIAKVQVGRAIGQVLPDVLRPHHGDAIGVAVRQVAQHDRAQDTEDGGVGADAERQRQHGDGGEAGAASERAEGELQILEEGRHRLFPMEG